jgi:hypothetical protein
VLNKGTKSFGCQEPTVWFLRTSLGAFSVPVLYGTTSWFVTYLARRPCQDAWRYP